MATRYVIRTVDEDWIDLVGEPVRIDDRRAAWAEAKRRVAADPDLKTVVLNRDTGAVLCARGSQQDITSGRNAPIAQPDHQGDRHDLPHQHHRPLRERRAIRHRDRLRERRPLRRNP